MNHDGVDDAQLGRLYEALASARRERAFQADADLGVLTDELLEWLDDDRQWVSAYGSQWVSLLDDIQAARGARGPALRSHLDGAASAWEELRASRKVLKSFSKHGPDPALRRRLQRSANDISARLADPAALSATWSDLIECTTHDDAYQQARCFYLLAKRQGHDPDGLTRHLRQILADDLIAVRYARGEPRAEAEPHDLADLSADERVKLASSVLPDAPRCGETIVWLRYALATIGPDLLRVGETVTFYRQEYLKEALELEPGPDFPGELPGDEFESVESLCTPTEAEGDMPHVIVRVVLGEVSVAEALSLAHETAELIVSLATLHGADPSIWALTRDHVKFVDGRESGASMHAPDVLGVTLDQESAISADPMPEVFDAWADDLEPHLPLRSPDLRRAAQLALWLRRARQTWEPGRLILCDRIFEQVAGWAGVIDRRTFIHNYLRLSWAFRRMRMELRDCWAQIASVGPHFHGVVTAQAWDEIKADPQLEYESVGRGWRVNLRGVLLRLDFLLERIDPDTELFERLSLLQQRVQSGKAVAHWADELLGDFDVLEMRARRLRNALVHGGPLSDESARSVLSFVDWLAADALHIAIRGFLGGGDLIGRFLDHRGGFESRLSSLRGGGSPVDLLFWDDA